MTSAQSSSEMSDELTTKIKMLEKERDELKIALASIIGTATWHHLDYNDVLRMRIDEGHIVLKKWIAFGKKGEDLDG